VNRARGVPVDVVPDPQIPEFGVVLLNSIPSPSLRCAGPNSQNNPFFHFRGVVRTLTSIHYRSVNTQETGLNPANAAGRPICRSHGGRCSPICAGGILSVFGRFRKLGTAGGCCSRMLPPIRKVG
jgi:hypothetical protein